MAFAGTGVLTWSEMAYEGEVQIRSASRVLAFNMVQMQRRGASGHLSRQTTQNDGWEEVETVEGP